MSRSAAGFELTEIDHVAIAVRDLDAAVAWYEATLGATVAHRELIETDGVSEALLKGDRLRGGSRIDEGGRRYDHRRRAPAWLPRDDRGVRAPEERLRNTDRARTAVALQRLSDRCDVDSLSVHCAQRVRLARPAV